MRRTRPALFKGRHFEAEIIILCVRWYLRFGLSLRNLEELMVERHLHVDHVTIWRGFRNMRQNCIAAAVQNCV
jgi:IS6 family transposase